MFAESRCPFCGEYHSNSLYPCGCDASPTAFFTNGPARRSTESVIIFENPRLSKLAQEIKEFGEKLALARYRARLAHRAELELMVRLDRKHLRPAPPRPPPQKRNRCCAGSSRYRTRT